MVDRLQRQLIIGLLWAAAGLAATPSAATAQTHSAETFAIWQGQEQIDGYRNIENVFATHLVRRGATVSPLPTAARQIDPHYSLVLERGGTDRYMERNRVAGLLVIHKGQIVLEKYALGQTAEDRWTSQSVAKSVNSTLLGAALKDGAIASLQDPVTKYVPELKGSAYDGVTIQDALKMRSGVSWDENFADPNSDIRRFSKAVAENRSQIPVLLGLRRVAPVGTRWHYNTGEAGLLGIIVQRATGKSEAEYLSEKIWAPFGMQRDAVWATTHSEELGGCCLNMTLRDYGRFGQFILGGGVAGGKQVLPENWVRDATRPYTPGVFGTIGYGYQWWPHANGAFEAIGIYGQSIYINPSQELIIVVSSAWPAPDWYTGYRRTHAFQAAVEKSLSVRAN